MLLHEMYATLTAKKPELALDHIHYQGPPYHFDDCEEDGTCDCEDFALDWFHWNGVDRNPVPDTWAAALIRVRWEDALPDGAFVFRRIGDCGTPVARVFESIEEGWNASKWYSCPIEALYHFHMEQA